jgi:hypothetical protein
MVARSIAIAAAVGAGVAAVTLPTARPALGWDRMGETVLLAANAAEDRGHTEARESDAQAPPASARDLSGVGALPLVYVPPSRIAPRARVGAGGARGSSTLTTPLALAPDHVGLTVTASPSLFWHIGARPGRNVDTVFTLIDERKTEPIAEITLDAPSSAGIQRLRLSKYRVKLEPEVEYTWSIALVPDAEQRSSDLVSLGFIRRVARPDGLPAGSRDAAAFAEAGIWYDALEALSDAVDADPSNGDLRDLRSMLLSQAQLDAAVE